MKSLKTNKFNELVTRARELEKTSQFITVTAYDIVQIFISTPLPKQPSCGTISYIANDGKTYSVYISPKGAQYLAYRMHMSLSALLTRWNPVDFDSTTKCAADFREVVGKDATIVLCIDNHYLSGMPKTYVPVSHTFIEKLEGHSEFLVRGEISFEKMVATFVRSNDEVNPTLKLGISVRNGMASTVTLAASYALITRRNAFALSKFGVTKHTSAARIEDILLLVEEAMTSDLEYDLIDQLEAVTIESPFEFVVLTGTEMDTTKFNKFVTKFGHGPKTLAEFISYLIDNKFSVNLIEAALALVSVDTTSE